MYCEPSMRNARYYMAEARRYAPSARLVVALNKADGAESAATPALPDVLAVSAKTGRGLSDLMARIGLGAPGAQ